ncbi:MAG: esterase-like activity of phytase family protein, partial [Pseudomonadota bacterium]
SEQSETLYAVCDDRGRFGPSRFYRLILNLESHETPELKIAQEITLKTKAGENYPKRSFDTEGIAIGENEQIYLSSEGDFLATKSAVPALLQASASGVVEVTKKMGPPVFPEDENWKENTYGIRFNLSLESLNYLADEKRLVTATENSLVQDDRKAGAKNGANTRFFLFDLSEGFPVKLISQKVYPISKIPSLDPGGESVIGVTDLIQLGAEQYLVLERSYLDGRGRNRAQLFFANCSEATDVQLLDKLKGKMFEPCRKELVYDFDVLLGNLSSEHPKVDNLEGMSFGPSLPDGGRLLIFVSDNNFSSGTQKTQFLYFNAKLNLADD